MDSAIGCGQQVGFPLSRTGVATSQTTTAIDLSLLDDRVHHATNYADVKCHYCKLQGSAEDGLKLAIACLRPIVLGRASF